LKISSDPQPIFELLNIFVLQSALQLLSFVFKIFVS